ncbi:MAG: carbohydrate kinase family protein [Chloroflexi bacterium]|nr:carbohydrate kinase family protein [Chloroflexota bacterium]
MRIVITGSIAYDYIMKFPGKFDEMLIAESLQSISVSFLVDEMTRHPGGTAPNIAYTLALLGERPLLVGAAGRDFLEYRDRLERVGIDTSGTAIHEDIFTASFFVTTDASNNQIASFYTGAMARARDISLKTMANGSRPDLVVISPNDPQAMQQAVHECKELGIRYLYDPSQQVARFDGEQLAEGITGAYIAVMNEYEYAAVCSKTGLNHSDLMERAEVIIVTRGKNGADIYTADETYHIPIFPTDQINDPTGVGDGFRGGLLKGLANGWSWELSGQVGALAAAYVLEHIGPQDHFYTPTEFVTRFREHFDDKGMLDSMLG